MRDRKIGATFGVFLSLMCGFRPFDQASAQKLPDGVGKAEFVHNCTACHRADMVVAVRKTPEDWRKSVDEMAARGTDGTKEDLDNVVRYLVANYSFEKPSPASAAAAPSAPRGGGGFRISLALLDLLRVAP